MFDSIKESVKGRDPAGWRGPGAFGTEWVGIGLRRMVMEVFEESHAYVAAKFIETSSNFIHVNVTWSKEKKRETKNKNKNNNNNNNNKKQTNKKHSRTT